MTKPRIVTESEQAFQPVARARGTEIAQLIGTEQGAPNFLTRRFRLAPGARIPAHRHPDIEHEQVMLRGEMVLGLGDETRTVRAGDAVFIPARTAHWYENRTGEPVEFLCMVPRTDSYETEWLEDPPEGAYVP